MLGYRSEHVSVESGRGPLQLTAGCARPFEVADGQQDLDIGGQEARAQKWIVGRTDDAADEVGRALTVPLRQAQQRESRLRIEARATGIAVGCFCLRKLAAQAMDLGLL